MVDNESTHSFDQGRDAAGFMEDGEELSDHEKRTRFLCQIEISKKCAQSIDLNSLRELKSLKSPQPIVTGLADIALSLIGIDFKGWPDFQKAIKTPSAFVQQIESYNFYTIT